MTLVIDRVAKSSIVETGRWVKENSPAILVGGVLPVSAQKIDTWKRISDGEFAIGLNGATKEVSCVDFRDVTNMDGVASEIDSAARAFGLSCSFEGSRFTFKTIATGKAQDVDFLAFTGSGTDISSMLYGTKELTLSLVGGADAEIALAFLAI